MATSGDSAHKASDLVKDYSCGACKSKNCETNAECLCETCSIFFCKQCLYHHDQIYVNHLTYGRGETNKWPLAKTIEDLLLKCDIHSKKKLKMFCEDHSQLCCSHCILLNHSQCTNMALISEAVKKLSVDMQQLSNKIQATVSELNKLKRIQEASLQSVEGSCSEKVKEIRELRKKLNASLDELEHKALKELHEVRTTLHTSLKKDVDNCSSLKDELQKLSEAVQCLHDKSNREMEFIVSRKCTDKLQESELFLKAKPVKVQSLIMFKENTNIEQYLSKQSSLGRIVDSMQSLKLEMNPDNMLKVKRKSQYSVNISNDRSKNCQIRGICSLPSGQIIIADYNNKRVKMLDIIVSSYCDMSRFPCDICPITSSEVAVTLNPAGVQFMSVINGQLVNGSKLELPHAAVGIAHHQGALYITSGTALYQYTLTGKLVKMLYESKAGDSTVYKCAVSPAGDKIYVTNLAKHQLLTLTTDGTLLSTFKDAELQTPNGVHVTPAGQILVCAYSSNSVIQVDGEGKKKLATVALQKDGSSGPMSICYNAITDQIIVEKENNISFMDLH